MLTQKIYKPTDKMSDLICENYNMLQVLTRFGLSLGFGDRTIEEVCREQQVDCPTFLVVVNFLTVGECPLPDRMKALSVPALMDYLKRAHSYYLDFDPTSTLSGDIILHVNQLRFEKFLVGTTDFYREEDWRVECDNA